jgi:2-C-methyl-D-erythritol 4-phosphate cytidylyltransferase/2-C-methyl-D-erythritol 2,4-cyclodiphosphate synthase
MHVTAIIAAGGRGRRFGAAEPKQLLLLGGRTLLEWSVGAFLAHPSIAEVVVALPQELAASPPDYLRRTEKPVFVVAGGPRRQDSVSNAFRAAAPDTQVIVIHDAARPFVSEALISRTVAAAAAHGAAIAGLGVHDTVKRVRSEREGRSPDVADRVVTETIPRETIVLAQTPQGFTRDVLAAALSAAERDHLDATDEAALAELAGFPVHVVQGEPDNVKITTADDLEAARWRVKPARTGRMGCGYDLHRLVPGRPLVLAGVIVPSDRGALGHSDADVICHATTDAVLGAAALGDIGLLFPDSDPRWKDARSVELLRKAVALAAAGGYEIGNVDVTVILEAPKLRPYMDDMRASLAGALELDVSRVSVKAKTNEGVDAVGRGEAIAAHAIAVLRRR